MHRQLTSRVSACKARIQAECNARAQGAARAVKADFAAVMGDAISADLCPEVSGAWSLSECIDENDALKNALYACCPDAQAYEHAVQQVKSHLDWTLRECRTSLELALSHTLNRPYSGEKQIPWVAVRSDEESGVPLTGDDETNANTPRTTRELIQTVAALERSIKGCVSIGSRDGMSQQRQDAIETHSEQLDFIENKAAELCFNDLAKSETNTQLKELRREWQGEARALYKDEEYLELQKELKSISTERVHHELELQSYFDHHSQGASQSDSVKPERVSLKIAPDLQSAKSGFRQIQLVDLYCLSRGNEMWAIIPDLLRVGHDIDPIGCKHWQPSIEAMPECIRPYYEEQSRAFAQKLLALCPSLRSTLLAEHKHGVSKTPFRACETCGVSIYWVMVQLFHPLSRDHRRSLEVEITKFPSRF